MLDLQTCPAGTSITTTGAVDASGCADCPAGTHESAGVCTLYAAGTSSTAVGSTDAATCVACATGGSAAGSTSCIAEAGCKDSRATNYDSAALVDTGLCEYTCDGLRTSIGITIAGGCLIHDLTSGWGRYLADGTYNSANMFNVVPQTEHWVVQGRPLAGSTVDAPLYSAYPLPGGIATMDARIDARYLDISKQGIVTAGRSHGPALTLETGHPCDMAGGHVHLHFQQKTYPILHVQSLKCPSICGRRMLG